MLATARTQVSALAPASLAPALRHPSVPLLPRPPAPRFRTHQRQAQLHWTLPLFLRRVKALVPTISARSHTRLLSVEAA